MIKIARLIITFDCNRRCPHCCNKYKSMQRLMRPVDSLKELASYDQVLITGGEPMLNPPRTLGFAKALKQQRPDRPVFLYTALYDPRIADLLSTLDGVHYTLHAPVASKDMVGFENFQDLILRRGARDWVSHRPASSYRLYIDSSVSWTIALIPPAWRRVEVKPWILEKDLVLPPGEDLLVWQGDL